MVLTQRALPSDRLVAAYNLLLAGAWAPHLDRGAYAAWIFAAHIAAAALPWLLARAPRKPSGPMTVLRDIYPLVFLLAFWPELDLVHDVRSGEMFDAPIAALDRLIFGQHLHALWMPSMPRLWLSELMFFTYFAYYPLIFLPPLLMLMRGRDQALRDMTFRLMVTYLGCYLVYLTVPVLGPHYLVGPYTGPNTSGVFYQLVESVGEAGSSRGATFPSSHVAGAATIAYLAWRWFPRWVAGVLTLEAFGVVLSTVYTQNHYAVDALAGVFWGLGLQMAVVPVLLKLFEPSRVHTPTPILPDFAPPFSASGWMRGGS